MPKFTLLKTYPDGSRHVAHVFHDEIEDYQRQRDAQDSQEGITGDWLTLPLEPAERR